MAWKLRRERNDLIRELKFPKIPMEPLEHRLPTTVIAWVIDKISKLESYVRENWKKIIVDLCLAIIVAIISIVVAFNIFDRGIERSRLAERKTFERKFAMILFEAGNNLAKLENINNAVDEVYVFLELSDDVMKDVIIDPQTYKYTGREYVYILSAYLTEYDVLDNQLNLLAQLRIGDRNDKKLVLIIKRNIAKMIYLSYLLEYQTQLYINIYHVGWPIQPPNHEEIMGYLKNMPDDIVGINNITVEIKGKLTKMTDMPKEIAEKQKRAVLRRLREYEDR